MSAVVLREVTKRFGSVTAVSRMTLAIPKGTTYGLIGPNGAGKTTSFSMMAGFLRPTMGSIQVLGHAPSDCEALRGRLSVLPQDALLPARELVGELLMFLARLQGIGRERREKCAREVLEHVGGKDWWTTRCNELSHGMAKRVQLAQALLGDPEVILLDEPTAGLDPRAAYEVRQIIAARRESKATLVVSSHNLQELETLCDEAAILDHGELVAHGSIAALTGASSEVIFHLGSAKKGDVREPSKLVPHDALTALPGVKSATLRGAKLIVTFDASATDAEDVIQGVAEALFASGLRLSGIVKGQGLEKRVMDLTDA